MLSPCNINCARRLCNELQNSRVSGTRYIYENPPRATRQSPSCTTIIFLGFEASYQEEAALVGNNDWNLPHAHQVMNDSFLVVGIREKGGIGSDDAQNVAYYGARRGYINVPSERGININSNSSSSSNKLPSFRT